MNFILTDEQLELRAVVREFLAGKSTEAAVRRLMAAPAGYGPAVWNQTSDQLGRSAGYWGRPKEPAADKR